jgi:undecaprenyl-diphosphatase
LAVKQNRRSLLPWLGEHSHLVLLAILLVVAGAWCFIALADEVREGETQRFDDRMIRALRRADNPSIPIGPAWVGEVARDLTALGGVTFLGLLTLFVAGYLLIAGKYHATVLVLIATIGGLILTSLLKHLFHRPRPELVPHLSYVATSSFPSGHSMMSAVVYLTLGTLLARVTAGWAVKIYLLACALFLTFLVGVSRVYMGVHYPTDVLAGWTGGLVWAILCWLAARYLQRRGDVETDSQETADLAAHQEA